MIWELLRPGRENAIPKEALIAATGLPDRSLRLQVARERKLGRPIITDTGTAGYYRPATEEEANRFVRSMRHRARETALAARAIETAVAGQERLW